MPLTSKVTLRVGTRLVVWAIGRKTQTVNVCTERARAGVYEWKVILPAEESLTAVEIGAAARPEDLIRMLCEDHNGRVAAAPGEVSADLRQHISRVVECRHRDDNWVRNARTATEACIEELVSEFTTQPFRHRVEHSLHMSLFARLQETLGGERNFRIGGSTFETGLVHKEWPETIPQQENGGRRGNFDLAVLCPQCIAEATLAEFEVGLIKPVIAIELGLNYDRDHLDGDVEKLLNSEIENAYIVHLERHVSRAGVDERIAALAASEAGVKIAFARMLGGCVVRKSLGDTEITAVG